MIDVDTERDDPDLEPVRRCHFCGAPKGDELVRVFGQWACESRTDCYQVLRRRYS